MLESIGAGAVNESESGYFLKYACINSFHIGATIKPATFFSIAVLLLLPAHAPTEICGVYPIIQASR